MKKGMVWLLVLALGTFLAACGDDDELTSGDPQAELVVSDTTSVPVVVVGVAQGSSKGNFTFTVAAHGDKSQMLPIDAAGTTYVISIAPAGGGLAQQYTHKFVNHEEYILVYDGIISGPGGAGDLQ